MVIGTVPLNLGDPIAALYECSGLETELEANGIHLHTFATVFGETFLIKQDSVKKLHRFDYGCLSLPHKSSKRFILTCETFLYLSSHLNLQQPL